MHKLIQGLHQFKNEHFPGKRELFEHLSLGQFPDALFITCCDSRINPHLITQSEPGDLFLLRNLGNIVPPYQAEHAGAASSTIEYAINVLKVKDIVVCGHSHCGAMNALLHPELLEDLPHTKKWLQHAATTQKIMKENYADLTPEQLLNVAIQENVLSQLESLRTHPSVAAASRRGDLTLNGWVYKIETGEVFAYQTSEEQFVAVAEGKAMTSLPSLCGTQRATAII